MKRVMSKLSLFMVVVAMMMCFSTTVLAQDLDNLNTGQGTTNEGSTSDGDTHNGSVTDYLQGYTPITDENMADAQRYATPITNLLGTLTGFIVVIVSAGIFVVTALDLAYIGLPFTRSFLNPEQAQAQGGGMSPMGGMGMGMGMRGGMGMGGMGAMGGMQGGAQPTGEQGLRRRWVSDEAVQCVMLANPQQQAGGMSPMGGMGMGMGMQGGMMGGAQPQQMPTKSVIMMYLKKRTFFLIVFAIATVLLTSSIFTDCGINLAELAFKVMDKINAMIQGINIG